MPSSPMNLSDDHLVAAVTVTLPNKVVIPSEEAADLAHAEHLDACIDNGLASMANALAKAHLELGRLLAEMNRTKGYRALGYPTWAKYVETKQQYGRTYLFYLLKLGRSGLTLEDLPEVGGAQLVEYAKMTDMPEKIPQLVQETWGDVQGLSIRQLRDRLKRHVADHVDEYRKPDHKRLFPKAQDKKWQKQLERQYKRLGEEERDPFLNQVAAFLNEHQRCPSDHEAQ